MKDMIICRCEGVKLSDIKHAIENEASSIPGLKIRTRSGMGMCQGRVCQEALKRIIQSVQEGQTQTVVLQNAKFPVRPIPLEDLSK